MTLKLNEISPAADSRQTRKRVGRGASAGGGKTCGRGHKGQNSRSGGGVRIGFEGGQLPLQKRVPQTGFRSRKGRTTKHVRLGELNMIEGEEVTLQTLVKAGIVPRRVKRARVFLSGSAERAFNVKGVRVTNGAKEAIVAAGGTVEEA